MNSNQIVYRTIVMKGTSEGLDKVAADLNKVAAAHQGVTVASEQTEKSTLSLEQALKRQSLRLDETVRAQNNIARERSIADKGLKEGLIDQQRHAELITLATQRYETASKATQEMGKQTRLTRHELINLSRQAQDVGVSLQAGQSPFTVLVQQGTQIADVFATSGVTIRGFFSQAIGWAGRFLLSWGGLATAVAAVGVAAVYVASQFKTASLTIEEALKEQNRLLKEGKTLIDAKASAEAKAQAQAKDLTEYEIMRLEYDLQLKINKAMDDAAKLGQRTTRLTPSPGVMGEPVPLFSEPLKDPGLDKLTAAWQALKAAQAAGLPGLKEYVTELGRIGTLHPELRDTVDYMIKAGRSSVELAQAKLELRAMSDALKGIATNAQLAALGFASMAQFNLSNLQAAQAAAATERMAVATLQLAQLYPGMSIEVAKQLYTLEQQLTVAQARTGAEQMVAQELVTINNLLLQGKTLEEATAVAAGQRALAEANVSRAINDQIHSLEDQIKLSKARTEGTVATTKAEIARNNALRQGASEEDAARLARATGDLEREENEKKSYSGFYGRQQAINSTYSTREEIAGRIQRNSMETADAMGRAAQYASSLAFWAESFGESIHQVLDMLPDRERQFRDTKTGSFQNITSGPGGWIKDFSDNLAFQLGGDPSKRVDIANLEVSKLSESLKENTESTDSLNATMQSALSPFYSQDPRTTKLGFRAGTVGNPDWLTGAANENAIDTILGKGAIPVPMGNAGGGGGAAAVMTPEQAYLDAIRVQRYMSAPGFADGGSFVVGGGDSAVDNKVAMFPVASGEQVVVNRNPQGRGGQVVNIDNRIIIQGSLDTDAMAKLKVSRYQQAQRMRAGLAQG